MSRSTDDGLKVFMGFTGDTYPFVLSVSEVFWVVVLSENIPNESVDELEAVVVCPDVVVV